VRFVSLNPNVRGYGPPLPLGTTMRGFAIGQVIASKNPAFKIGERLETMGGWAEHSIVVPQEAWKLPRGVKSEVAVHMLGNSGLTAFFGVTEILKPKQGETAVVSAAAGATGMIAAQILKIMGCRVIGVAGSQEKCRWLVEELGVDVALNRKDPPDVFLQKFKEATPNFVDTYFDNTVGLFTLSCLWNGLSHLAECRVASCSPPSSNESHYAAG
jgi:NADPH-dependent curcumin reductase CurA